MIYAEIGEMDMFDRDEEVVSYAGFYNPQVTCGTAKLQTLLKQTLLFKPDLID